ncbi:MAG: hypothetical protein ACK47B_22320 [Armatimonadota bacterium]
MNISSEGWGWLAASIPLALLADFAVFRLGLELLKPRSTQLFWATRAGKLAGFAVWVAYVNGFWWPRYVADPGLASTLRIAEIAVGAVLLVLAVVTLPRGAGLRRTGHE